MKVLFAVVFTVVAVAMVQGAPSGWNGWSGWNGLNGWNGLGWVGHGGWSGNGGAVIGPVAGSAVIAGPSGLISSHQGNAGTVVAGVHGAWGWNGGHGHGGWW